MSQKSKIATKEMRPLVEEYLAGKFIRDFEERI
jgi:hypothetical protein